MLNTGISNQFSTNHTDNIFAMKTPLILLLSFVILLLTSCDDGDTEDPQPLNYVLSISVSNNTIDENGGTSTITVSIDMVNQDDPIPFELGLTGSATLDTDYRITGSTSIASGSQSTTLTLTAIDDSDVEGDETIAISLQENQPNVTVSGGNANLTITDDDMTPPPPACTGTADTYLIDLDPTNCTVDIQTVLGVTAMYTEQVNGGDRVINSNSIPNHNVGQFPNMGNPNTITEINNTYTITTSPTNNSSVTLLTTNEGAPRYRFGILYNGILLAPIAAEFFVNTSTGMDNTDWNENALSSEISLGTDCNNSHVFPSGMYHHHATPSAFIETLNIDGSTPVQIGWAADGYPIYYKYGNKGGSVVELVPSYQLKTEERGGDDVSAPSGCPDGTYTQDYEFEASIGDLDECNGYDDPVLGYIYVITDTYPSVPRCFVATPSGDFTNN